MTNERIKAAEVIAMRFLTAIKAVEARKKSERDGGAYLSLTGFKESGALRRASMDLTRALAEMRKP